ncbi:hypothetical protein Tco_1156777 [Tanacetum coccineum]
MFEFKDSLIKPITRILVGVAVLTALIVLVMKETPEWAKKLNITDGFVIKFCGFASKNPQLLYKKTVFALFPTVAILLVHVYFCTVDASIGVQLRKALWKAVIEAVYEPVQVFVEEPLKKHDIRKARAAKELATASLALLVLVMLKYLCA